MIFKRQAGHLLALIKYLFCRKVAGNILRENVQLFLEYLACIFNNSLMMNFLLFAGGTRCFAHNSFTWT